jgi:hypothetical protein
MVILGLAIRFLGIDAEVNGLIRLLSAIGMKQIDPADTSHQTSYRSAILTLYHLD